MNESPAKTRIGSIDGWRAVAAVGVLYGHVLGTLNMPGFKVLGVDILKLFSLWGYGVHLFFVISGICFYLVLGKEKEYPVSYILSFWKKRWVRLAPAFYISCIVYSLVRYQFLKDHYWQALLANFTFVQTYVPHAEINAIYWSLSVEWLFYVVLPFIFIASKKTHFYFVIAMVLLLGFGVNFLHYKYNFIPLGGWKYTFPANFEHFGWGMLIGYLFKNNVVKSPLVNSTFGFIIGLALAYLGKYLFTGAFVAARGDHGYIFETIGPLIMTLGFAWLILNSLNNAFVSKMMGNRVFTFLGKISYSFYVWHTLILTLVYSYLGKFFSYSASGVLLLLSATLIILVPFSWLSYRLLEAFYFKGRRA